MKKLLALILALAMTLSLAACGAASNGSAGTSGTSGSAAASGEKVGTDTESGSFKIGYNQLVTGDFALDADGRARDTDTAKGGSALPRHTYSTMGLFKKALFAAPYCNIPAGNPQGVVAPLAPVLRAGMAQGRISASLYTGRWADVGTPQRLAELNEPLA